MDADMTHSGPGELDERDQDDEDQGIGTTISRRRADQEVRRCCPTRYVRPFWC